MSDSGLRGDLRFRSPDDVYMAILGLGDGLDDRAAHAALAAFALILANHVGDDRVVMEAIALVKAAFAEFPEAVEVGAADRVRAEYQVGGALAALRKVIELKPAPSVPGALTS